MAKRILVVDDAPITRLMLKDILVANGYDVVAEASDGVEAVEKFRQLRPDLMTMDIIMPNKDGLAALEEVLAIDKDAKVVMVTAIDQRDSLMKAIHLGATDYIVKPFEEERVVAAIINIFGGTK
ncbi:MAG TPA: two-component system response regulator [Candidatus Omnitrophica bacterium]|nr:two-component system response regulator [Candidatus Omnitrophota bacterium]